MTDIFDDTLNKFGITSSSSKQLLFNKSTIGKYSKFQDLFVEGKRNGLEYILVSGIMQRYNMSDDGNMVTTGFYMPQSVVTPHFARTNKGKNIFGIQTITDVVVIEIPVKEMDNLRYTNEEFHEFGQRILESELSQTYFNEIVYRTYNAKERLLTLRKQFPNLENLAPHNIISSYLGITNVSFSRLRNELYRK